LGFDVKDAAAFRDRGQSDDFCHAGAWVYAV
jgi:hypothetical protein